MLGYVFADSDHKTTQPRVGAIQWKVGIDLEAQIPPPPDHIPACGPEPESSFWFFAVQDPLLALLHAGDHGGLGEYMVRVWAWDRIRSGPVGFKSPRLRCESIIPTPRVPEVVYHKYGLLCVEEAYKYTCVAHPSAMAAIAALSKGETAFCARWCVGFAKQMRIDAFNLLKLAQEACKDFGLLNFAREACGGNYGEIVG